jgi:hypothetical protein
MTTVSDIILDAYRESNLIPVSTTPTVAEQTEGLRLLNRIFLSAIGNKAGDRLQPFPFGRNNVAFPTSYDIDSYIYTSNWFVPLNKQLVLNLTEPKTIRLHPYPQDGSKFGVVDVSENLATFPLTIEGNGRNIDGSPTITLNTDGLKKNWFFKQDLGGWVEIPDTLAANDPWFFPKEFDDMFITLLAMRLNPRHGQNMSVESAQALKTAQSEFKARYGQERNVTSDPGLYRLSYPANHFNNFDTIDDTSTFNVGVPSRW